MANCSWFKCWLLGIFCLGLAAGQSQTQKNNSELLVCGDSLVLVVDYQRSKDSIPAVVWQWDARTATGLPEKYRTTYFRTVDDSKVVAKGKQILISSSSGGVALVNRADKKVLFYAYVPNAHSIELLPNNRVAVAGSTAKKNGNCVALFNISQPEKEIFRDSLFSGHGVVWDDKRQVLYALGYSELRQYKLQDWNTSAPKLKLDKTWKIPGESGHDLQLSPDGNALYLTEHTSPWVFNLKTAVFTKLPELAGTANVKSFGKHPQTGQLLFTIPEESWWTYHVKFLNPSKSLAFPGMHVYKARWATVSN